VAVQLSEKGKLLNATADLVVHFEGKSEPTLYQSGLTQADADAKAKEINRWSRARHPTPQTSLMKGVLWASVTTITIVHRGKGAS
jgi:hypothetical protein